MKRTTVLLSVVTMLLVCAGFAHGEIMNALASEPYRAGIDPDPGMFIENREKMHTVVEGAVNWTQRLSPLTGGDPLFPEEKGAVLVNIKGVAHATIDPGRTTDRVTLSDEQRIYYFYQGNGTATCNGKTSVLRDGIGLLVPPGLEFSIENTGTIALAMYIIQEPIPAGFTPNTEMLVRDEYTLAFRPKGGHWWHLGTEQLFGSDDGLAVLTGCRPVKFDAMTMSQPHSHNQNAEECWFSVRGTSNQALLGKKLFDFSPGTIYKIPPDAISAHANINTSENSSMKVFWMMVSRSGDRPDYSRLDPAELDMAIHPDIDMFISNWREEAPIITHGGLVERDVFTQSAGDPVKPHRRGAVLTYTRQFSHATLYGRTVTVETTPLDEQELFYVIGGNGEIEANGRKYALRKDVAVLVPKGMRFKITNLDSEDLRMYHIIEPAPTGFTGATELIWRDESLQSVHTRTAHWVNTNRRLVENDQFSDLSLFLTVTIPPMTFAQPHSHGDKIEEVWLALTDNAYVLLGKELRKLDKGTAYMIPPDDATPHANFNITGEPVRFLYFARGWGK